jgi:predicted nucleic acid-binding protein
MHFLPDTSGLAKRYLHEAGSERVRALWDDKANVIHVSQLTRTEFASVLARRIRDGMLDGPGSQRASRLFSLHERKRHQLVPLTLPIQVLAEQLLFRHTLPAADSLQVATAMEVSRALLAAGVGLTFVTADRRQATAAEAEGLPIVYVGA